MLHTSHKEELHYNELPRHNNVDKNSPEQRVEKQALRTPKSLADFKVNPSFDWENTGRTVPIDPSLFWCKPFRSR